ARREQIEVLVIALDEIQRHQEVRSWICVGDLPDAEGRYQPVDAPLYFIKGNNEDFDLLASGDLPGNLHYLPNAVEHELDGLKLAGLGGTLAPTWYETPAAELPPGKKGSARAAGSSRSTASLSRVKSRDDKRRHFVRDEVEACKKMRDVSIFLSHEAPRPFRVGPVDAGKTPINEVLAAMQPRLHLFGHHHRFTEQDRQGVRSVGLDLVSRSYLLIDVRTLAYEQRLTTDD
ncbi:MAG TPA: metallophosphoesterase, partial [Vicinamibacterales bacterium]|nr:metallophosphoesterase [Vicinamibacterales bacterium]